jgi:hypothetical protein
MIVHHNPVFTTLYYRSAEYREQGLDLADIPRVNEYYPVVSYPRREMTGDRAVVIADDFITLTCSPHWRMRARRAIEPGDLFTCAPALYMFIAPDDPRALPRTAQLIEQTQTWTHLHVIRLGVGWQHMRELCKV